MTKPKNRAKCALCGDVIISKHRHDFVQCSCGAIFVDGGNDYWRCGGDFKNLLRYRNRKWVPMVVNNEPEEITIPKTWIDNLIEWWKSR